jgi:hypothetical protein
MNVAEPFIRRPVATTLLVLTILIFGVLGYVGSDQRPGATAFGGSWFAVRREPGGCAELKRLRRATGVPTRPEALRRAGTGHTSLRRNPKPTSPRPAPPRRRNLG